MSQCENRDFVIAASVIMQTWVQPIRASGVLSFLVLVISADSSFLNQGCAVAQEVETVISGSIVDAAGRPASGAIVALCRHSEDISHGKSVTADASGVFSIAVSAAPKVLEAMHLECKCEDGSAIGYRSLRSLDAKIDLHSIALQLSPIKAAHC